MQRQALTVALVAGVLGASAVSVRAQEACPEGNLIAKKKPHRWVETMHPKRITDGITPEEGDGWKSDLTTHLTTGGAYVIFRLDAPTRIRSIFLQGDNNDTYEVLGSLDGKSWTSIWTAPMVDGAGMRPRTVEGLDTLARYLKVTPGEGDASYSLGEVAFYCKHPAEWPPTFEVKKGKVTNTARDRERWLARTKIFVGIAGFLLFSLVMVRRKQGKPLGRWLERTLLVVVALGGGWTWMNFASFHGGRKVHFHDSFHYFMGSKYFKENRYTKLYHCSAVAEAEMPKRRAFVRKRIIRNLADNHLEKAEAILAHPEICTEAFTPKRWQAFKKDLQYFRRNMGAESWEKVFKDHGYNATPVWNMVGSWLANGGPASNKKLKTLALIDGILYLSLFLMILWAFGLEVCALALLVWGVGYPWHYFWTGGAFGRVPWLFMLVAGVCLLKKGKHRAGGWAIAWSALLRIFPGAVVGGLVITFWYNLRKKRMITPAHRGILIGAAAAIVTLVPLSLPAAGGLKAWPEFLANSMKHKHTPLTNHMGMPTLFSFDPNLISRKTRDGRLEDPFIKWKNGRQETLDARKIFYWPTVFGLLALVGFFGIKYAEADWETVAVGTVMIIAMFELTCYYYNFIILLAPVAIKRLRHAQALIVASIVSQVIQLVGGWYDTQFLWESLLFLGLTLYFIIDIIVEKRREERRGDEPEPPQPEAASIA